MEHADGSRCVEVVAQYQGSTHVVKHFTHPGAGRPRFGSLVALAVGLCLAIGGAAAFGSQIYSVKRQELHRAKTQEFIQERGLPQKYVPRIRAHPFAELIAVASFVLGLFGLLFGVLRTRDDLRTPSFTIGEHPRCTFSTPMEALPPDQPAFPLVHPADGVFQLTYTPKMTGVVELPDHDPLALSALEQTGITRPAPGLEGAYQLPIIEGLRARVCFSDSSFVIKTVATPKAVTGGSAVTSLAGMVTTPISMATLGSAAVVGLFLLLLSHGPAAADTFDADGIDRGKLSRRFRSKLTRARPDAELLQKPRQPKPTTRLEVTGPGGKRDDRLSPKGGVGPISPVPGTTGHRRASRGMGMVGLLKNVSRRLGDMFASSAVGADVEDALGALVGHRGGDRVGLAWLDLSFGGRCGGGGGGCADFSPHVFASSGWSAGLGQGGSLSTKGDLRAPGSGREVGAYRPAEPTVYSTQLESSGALEPHTIRRVIRRHMNQIKRCYVAYGLASNPRLRGIYTVAFTIDRRGRVHSVHTASSVLNHPATERCVRTAIKTWRFPKPLGSMPYVVYPFHFKPSGGSLHP